MMSGVRCRPYHALIGGPNVPKPEEIPGFVAELHAADLPRSERIRDRCDEVVGDKETAQKLKSWFPSW